MGIRKSLLALLTAGSVTAQAGSMSDFLSNVVIEADSPRVIQSQTRNMISFGGARIRNTYSTFQPFQVVPPSIRAGCSGIDITFGGFSYFNPEYLVRFFEDTLASASAYLFQLGLDLLCPSCSKLLNTLTGLANQINALGMNSCQAGQLVANFVFNQLSSYVNRGATDSWLQAVDSKLRSFREMLNGWQNDVAGYLNSAQVQAIINNGSLLRYAQATTGVSNEFYELAKGIFGDITFERAPNDEKCIAMRRLAPVISAQDVAKAVIESCGQSTATVQASSYNIVLPSFCYYAKQRIDSIITKIRNKTPLSSDDLTFLATYPFPVYKLFKVYAPYPEVLESLSLPLAKYTASVMLEIIFPRYIYQILNGANSLHSLAVQKRLPANCESSNLSVVNMIEDYIDDIKETSTKISSEYLNDYREELINHLKVANTIIQFERQMYSKFADNPIISSYIFAKSLPYR